MAKIIINRSSEYSNKMRSIGIYLGNDKIINIKDGESLEYEIKPGKYKLKAKIDWCSSNEIKFTIEENDTLRFNLNGTNPFLSLYYITFGKNDYLKLIPIK